MIRLVHAFSPGWLLASVGISLLGLQFLFWSRMPFDEARFAALGALVLVYLLWERRKTLRLESSLSASFGGAVLAAFFLWKSWSAPGELFLSIAPLIWGAGLGLMAAGTSCIRQFPREGLILAFLAVPPLLRSFIFDAIGFDLSPATASCAGALLRLCGQAASTQDVVVTLPTAAITVYSECSGLKSISFLFGLAVLFWMLFPPRTRIARLLILPGAVMIAFAVNAGRVAVLALLAAGAQEGAFEYWHKRAGAPVFEVIAVGIFLAFYRGVLLRLQGSPAVLATANLADLEQKR